MKPKKYQEWKVALDWSNKKKPEPIKERKLRIVSIHEHEAELLNRSFKQTRKFYELIEEPDDKEYRDLGAARRYCSCCASGIPGRGPEDREGNCNQFQRNSLR